jgi:hypothetical protein
MSVVENIDRPMKTDLGLNAKVDNWDEMSLEPLRELMSDFGAHGVVDDLDEVIGILISILYQPDGVKWSRKYLQDRLYAMHKFKMAFTKLERSVVHEVKEFSLETKKAC